MWSSWVHSGPYHSTHWHEFFCILQFMAIFMYRFFSPTSRLTFTVWQRRLLSSHNSLPEEQLIKQWRRRAFLIPLAGCLLGETARRWALAYRCLGSSAHQHACWDDIVAAVSAAGGRSKHAAWGCTQFNTYLCLWIHTLYASVFWCSVPNTS